MYPSSPAQPPRPQATTTVREIPGVTKRPTAPMRGMAPQMDAIKSQAVQVMAARQNAPTGPAPAMKPMSQQAAPPVQSARPMAPQQASAPQSGGYAAAAKSVMERRMQSGTPAPAVSADDNAQRVAAARAVQAQMLAKQKAQGAEKGKNALADALVQGAFQGLGDKTRQVPGMEWDFNTNSWTADNSLPPGVKQGDPGTYYDPADGKVKYDPKGAVSKALATDTEKTISGSYEDFLMSPEEKAAQIDELRKAAANAMWQQGQAMAARGMGGSGVQAMGLGETQAKLESALVDMNASDRAQAIEQFLQQRGQDLGAYAQDRAATASESNVDTNNQQWREQFDYQKSQDAEANAVTQINNALGLTGNDQLAPEDLAAGLDAYKAGDDAFKTWLRSMGGTTDSNGDGVRTLSKKPDSYSGDWGSLTIAQQKAIEEAYASGKDPAKPPPFFTQARPGEDWASLSDADKAHEWGLYLAGDNLYDFRSHPEYGTVG